MNNTQGGEKIKALIIDDEEESRKSIIHHLKEEFPEIECDEIVAKIDFLNALEKSDFDVVITDYQVRWGNGIEILREIKKRNPFIPVIMFTSTGTEEVAVEAMKIGLDDYLVKSPGHFIKLPAVVETSIEKARVKKQEKILSLIVENAKEAVVSVDKDGKIIYVNKAVESIFGWKVEKIIGKPCLLYTSPSPRD